MKKINFLFLLAAFVYIFSIMGCKEFLDKPIEDQIPAESVDYTEISQMYMPVSAVYGAGGYRYMITWPQRCIDLIRSDFVVKGGKISDSAGLEEVLEKYMYMYYYGYIFFIDDVWIDMYNLIARTNKALDELNKFRENAAGSDLVLNDQYKAEVRFFRAMAYWRLARVYGNVCWFDKGIATIDLRLSPRNEVYDWIIAELKDIRENLPEGHPNQLSKKGQVTRWAADMVLAKAAADVQDYATMEQAAGEIVNSDVFNLYPDYYELFTSNCELCNENIFEFQHYFYNDSTNTNIRFWYRVMGIAAAIKAKIPVNGNYDMQEGWGFSMPSKKFVDLMNSRGETVRRKRNIISPESITPKGDSVGAINANLESLIQKYESENLPNGVVRLYPFKEFMESEDRHIIDTNYGGYNNIRVFRYADALLLYAEALVHNSGAGAGDEYLNLVRERAKLLPLSGATLDQIIEERGVELFHEWGGDRFYDMVRLGKTSELGSNFNAEENKFLPTPKSQIDWQPGLAEPPVKGLFPLVSE